MFVTTSSQSFWRWQMSLASRLRFDRYWGNSRVQDFGQGSQLGTAGQAASLGVFGLHAYTCAARVSDYWAEVFAPAASVAETGAMAAFCSAGCTTALSLFGGVPLVLPS